MRVCPELWIPESGMISFGPYAGLEAVNRTSAFGDTLKKQVDLIRERKSLNVIQ
jgi:hypothetical protein